jgi:hypothetical protein
VCRRWAVGPICQGGVASYYSHANYCTANQSDRALFKHISKLACVEVDNEGLPRSIDRRIATAYGSVRAGWVLAPIVALRGLYSSFSGNWSIDTEDRNHIWARTRTNPGGLEQNVPNAVRFRAHRITSIWSTLFCARCARIAGQLATCPRASDAAAGY